MCSTPFGIIGIFTRLPHTERPVKHVLNAFRHHWNLHHGAEDVRIHGQQVLNAFRHHWNLHVSSSASSRRATECSTPFGIIGIFTRCWSLPTRATGCAQRLSASLESSRRRIILTYSARGGC